MKTGDKLITADFAESGHFCIQFGLVVILTSSTKLCLDTYTYIQPKPQFGLVSEGWKDWLQYRLPSCYVHIITGKRSTKGPKTPLGGQKRRNIVKIDGKCIFWLI